MALTEPVNSIEELIRGLSLEPIVLLFLPCSPRGLFLIPLQVKRCIGNEHTHTYTKAWPEFRENKKDTETQERGR